MPHVHDGGEGGKAPLLSFLTSAYQTERYVSETIESVLAQTRGDWQLIVVDNGNSDEMARIVSNYIISLRRARSELLADDMQVARTCGPRCVPAAAHGACRRRPRRAATEPRPVGRDSRLKGTPPAITLFATS
jgi:glycosyltransferase involved in cell wall biosynthesis